LLLCAGFYLSQKKEAAPFEAAPCYVNLWIASQIYKWEIDGENRNFHDIQFSSSPEPVAPQEVSGFVRSVEQLITNRVVEPLYSASGFSYCMECL
jgi:hypothetical protein